MVAVIPTRLKCLISDIGEISWSWIYGKRYSVIWKEDIDSSSCALVQWRQRNFLKGVTQVQSYCFALSRGCDVTAVWFILSIGSLSNDNADVNENGKTAIGLDWQNSKSARASRLFVRFFTVTAWLRPREMQNFTYCGEREYETTTLLFFSWTFLKSFRIQLQHLTNWTRWNKCDEFAVLFIPSFYVLSGLFLFHSIWWQLPPLEFW